MLPTSPRHRTTNGGSVFPSEGGAPLNLRGGRRTAVYCSCLCFIGDSACRVGAIVGLSTMSGTNASDLGGRLSDRRKLIVVVYADMVGYSRLIELDDAGTLERLRTLRRNLIDPAIDEHGGKVVQTGGDSLLIVFDSIRWCSSLCHKGPATDSGP